MLLDVYPKTKKKRSKVNTLSTGYDRMFASTHVVSYNRRCKMVYIISSRKSKLQLKPQG